MGRASPDAGADISVTDAQGEEEGTAGGGPADARIREGAIHRDRFVLDDDAGAASAEGGDAPNGPVCGDGKKDGNEECDDGNQMNGDGCSSWCAETGGCDQCLVANSTGAVGSDIWAAIWPPCEHVEGVATFGEGAGQARIDLCKAVYQCALQTHCIGWQYSDIAPCYCGTAIGSACLTPNKANGPCRVAIENGLESIDPNFITGNLSSTNTATGVALGLLQIASDICGQECFAGATDGGAP